VTAFAFAALRAKGGGDGSRTRVLKAIRTTFYMFRRSLISEGAGEPSRIPLQSIHVIDSPVAAVAPARASLLSSHSGLAGVGWNASWLIKPRELDLRNLHLVCLIRFFTRPTNHPRHASWASHFKSKPLRPQLEKQSNLVFSKRKGLFEKEIF